MKYRNNPVQNAAFNHCVGFLAEMIEKYGANYPFHACRRGKVICWGKSFICQIL